LKPPPNLIICEFLQVLERKKPIPNYLIFLKISKPILGWMGKISNQSFIILNFVWSGYEFLAFGYEIHFFKNKICWNIIILILFLS